MKFTIKEVKATFNASAILTPAEKMQRRLLSQFGGYTRVIMRNSIKQASGNEKSQPGSPPLWHRGRISYRDTIFFVVDMREKDVVIGGALLTGTAANGQTVPGILEHGGTAMIRVGKGNAVKKIPVTIRARPHAQPAYDIAIKKKLPGLIAGGIMREV